MLKKNVLNICALKPDTVTYVRVSNVQSNDFNFSFPFMEMKYKHIKCQYYL